jgi:hypothetical protein
MPSSGRDKDKVAAGLAHCAAHGITSMVNMDGNRYTCVLLQEMEAEGRLTARVKVPFHLKPHMELAELERASAMAAEFTGDWVRGLRQDVHGRGGRQPHRLYAERLSRHDGTRRAAVRGRAVQGHLRRDRPAAACRSRSMPSATGRCGRPSTAMRRRRRANGPRDSRHRIEHIELIDRADVPRLGALGITASVQPPHPPGAMDFPMSTMEHVFHRDRWRMPICGRRWPTMARPGLCQRLAGHGCQRDARHPGGADPGALEGCRMNGWPDGGAARLYGGRGLGGASGGADGHLKPGTGGGSGADRRRYRVDSGRDLGRTGIALTIAGGRVTHDPGFAG